MTAGATVPASVVMMCGLPASGKTTTAGRLHAYAGGVLIRSCDIYTDLGIRLQDWVVRTRGFTVDVHEYDQVRDRAYEEIARRLKKSLAGGGGLVILDAVYGERAKRDVIYAICRSYNASLTLIHCRCDDANEVACRFDRRLGRESTPEHEASDYSVFRDIARRWEDPSTDVVVGGDSPTILTIDTLPDPPVVIGAEESLLPRLLLDALSMVPARTVRS